MTPSAGAATTTPERADSTSASTSPAPSDHLIERLAARADGWDDAVAGRLVVTTETPSRRDALVTALGQTAPRTGLLGAPDPVSVRPVAPRTIAVEVEPGTEARRAATLARTPGVIAVEPDGLSTLARVPNDPAYPTQWSHQRTGVEDAWAQRTDAVRPDGSHVVVAVIDSGVDARVPDLADRVVAQVDASTGTVRPGTRGDNDTCATQGDGDVFSHGTAVAGVVGAHGDNGVDLTGVAWDVGILDIAVLSNDPSIADPQRCVQIPDSVVIAAISAAIDGTSGMTADVINLSLSRSGATCPSGYQAALDDARRVGTTVVSVSGNGGATATSVPAICDGVISVAATTVDGAPATYSAANAWVDVAAPGGERAATGGQPLPMLAHGDAPHSVTAQSGTSFAAPYVAGAAALLLAERPDLDPDDVLSVLQSTASNGGHDDALGWGEIRPAAGLRLVTDGGTIAPPHRPEPAPLRADHRPPPSLPAGQALRLAPPRATTDPIAQSIHVSATTFRDRGAVHAVIARADDYPDALAGASLGFGVGPVLFTPSSGGLDPGILAELDRVLPRDRTVYVLGGEAAVPAQAAADLAAGGWDVVRLGGMSREETAALVADELTRRLPQLGSTPSDVVLLATRSNWPDAVAAGNLGAQLGIPVLLTPVDLLAGDTADALADLSPQEILIVGGTEVVDDATAAAAGAAAGGADVVRISGPARDETALAVSTVAVDTHQAFYEDSPRYPLTVNLRRDDGFAHVLSASAFLGAYVAQGGYYLPVDGLGGEVLPVPVRAFACARAAETSLGTLVIGNTDLVADASAQDLAAALAGSGC